MRKQSTQIIKKRSADTGDPKKQKNKNFFQLFQYICLCSQPLEASSDFPQSSKQNGIQTSYSKSVRYMDDQKIDENQRVLGSYENQSLIYYQEQSNLQLLQTKSILLQLIKTKSTTDNLIFLNVIGTSPSFYRDYAYYLRQVIDSEKSSNILFDIHYDLQERLYGQFLKLNTLHNLVLAVQLIESSKSLLFESPIKMKKSSSMISQSYENIPKKHTNEVFDVIFIAEEFPFKRAILTRMDKIFVIPFTLDKSDFLVVKKEYLTESQKKLVVQLLRNYMDVLERVVLILPPFINLVDIVHILQICQYLSFSVNSSQITSFTLESVVSQQSNKLELIVIRFNQQTQRQIVTCIARRYFGDNITQEETLISQFEGIEAKECLRVVQKLELKFKGRKVVTHEDKVALIEILREVKLSRKQSAGLIQQLLPPPENNSLKRQEICSLNIWMRSLSSINKTEAAIKEQRIVEPGESDFTYESLPNSYQSGNYINDQLFSAVSSNEFQFMKRGESNRFKAAVGSEK